jgi:hypothetical protein
VNKHQQRPHNCNGGKIVTVVNKTGLARPYKEEI